MVVPDVALDPYSIYGHDGIIANGDVDNKRAKLDGRFSRTSWSGFCCAV
jgi:delta-aminolevulinic acid dehydratase/porphobilinogen synthase